MTFIFELWRDFCTVRVIAKFRHFTFSRSKVIMRTNTLTNRQTNRRRWKHPPRFDTLSRRVTIPITNSSFLIVIDYCVLANDVYRPAAASQVRCTTYIKEQESVPFVLRLPRNAVALASAAPNWLFNCRSRHVAPSLKKYDDLKRPYVYRRHSRRRRILNCGYMCNFLHAINCVQ